MGALTFGALFPLLLCPPFYGGGVCAEMLMQNVRRANSIKALVNIPEFFIVVCL